MPCNEIDSSLGNDDVVVTCFQSRMDFIQRTLGLTPLTLDNTSKLKTHDNYEGSLVRDFLSDISIAQEYAKGGVFRVNTILSDHLSVLKDGAIDEQKVSSKIINEILYRCIYVIPHKVSSIEFEIDTQKLEADPNRILSALQEDNSQSILVRLPLPFSFYAGAFGSGDRAARSASKEEAYISFEGTNKISPYLFLHLTTTSHIKIPLESVNRIQLGSSHDFTPIVDVGQSTKLLSRTDLVTPVSRYLNFRHFRAETISFKNPHQPKQEAYLPFKHTRGLWDTDVYFWGETLKRGFVAYSTPDSSIALLELNNIRTIGFSDQLELVQRVFHWSDSRKMHNIKQYNGNDVIARLASIPVMPRSF